MDMACPYILTFNSGGIRTLPNVAEPLSHPHRVTVSISPCKPDSGYIPSFVFRKGCAYRIMSAYASRSTPFWTYASSPSLVRSGNTTKVNWSAQTERHFLHRPR